MKKEMYGEQFREHLLEQYKLYVEMADRVSDRRERTNRFYISLLLLLLALLSVVITKDVLEKLQKFAFMAVAMLGLVLCALWELNIRSYRKLNSGKFTIIHEMEQHLPYKCYDREWKILNDGQGIKYLQLTRIEQWIPIVVAVLYALLFIYSWMLCVQ